MKTSDKGIAFIVAHEGIVPGPYLDSVGVWTYGIGHTANAGAPNPATMPRGMPLDLDKELQKVFALFRSDLAKFEARVNRRLGGKIVPQHQFDAAVSFDFNTGWIDRAKWVEAWIEGRVGAASMSMVQNFRKPAEIIERREAEGRLLASGDYGSKTAAVWQLNGKGAVIWKPVRTLTPAQIVALMRPSTWTEPTKTPAKPVAAVGLSALIAWLVSIFSRR